MVQSAEVAPDWGMLHNEELCEGFEKGSENGRGVTQIGGDKFVRSVVGQLN
jgi:hypothetical protein